MRAEHTAMAGNQRALFVDQHRVGEAKFTDRGSDLGYLLVAMSASISGVWDQPITRPPLDFIARPRPWICRADSRARRDGGSVGAFTRRPTRSRPRSASRH